jgi:hypothetical protein
MKVRCELVEWPGFPVLSWQHHPTRVPTTRHRSAGVILRMVTLTFKIRSFIFFCLSHVINRFCIGCITVMWYSCCTVLAGLLLLMLLLVQHEL